MKAILKFSLPDDQEEFDAAVQGMAIKIALHDFSEYLRRLKKSDVPFESPSEAVETISEAFFQRIGDLLWQ